MHAGTGVGPSHRVEFRARRLGSLPRELKWVRYLRDSDKITALTVKPDDSTVTAVAGVAGQTVAMRAA